MATTADAVMGASQSQAGAPQRRDPDEDPAVFQTSEEAPAPLALLADEYARSPLEALSTGPMRGRDLLTECEASRATVYRRLNRLVEAGLVSEGTVLDPDGHHCTLFRLARDSLTVTVEDGGLTVTVRS